MSTARFSVRCKSTRPGQSVGVAGSWTDWKAAGDFSGQDFPLWTGIVETPTSSNGGYASLEYKFVIHEGGRIITWEETPSGKNRLLTIPFDCGEDSVNVDGVTFGSDVQSAAPPAGLGYDNCQANGGGRKQQSSILDGVAIPELDEFEKALVEMNNTKRSWRLRLSFVRSAFSDPEFAKEIQFNPRSLDCLVTVSTYLNFLSSGQVVCSEDNGHHRPNHHACEAQQIEDALDALLPAEESGDYDEAAVSWAPYIARSIYPQLPSYASQFTVSVPLTRIRDIAHRGDIPHELKQEIKNTLQVRSLCSTSITCRYCAWFRQTILLTLPCRSLSLSLSYTQNKIHRCCGPEDIRTCENLLRRVETGGYSPDFVHQLRVFYGELREFFNASSLDDRLSYLANGAAGGAVDGLARKLLDLKQSCKPAMEQLASLTDLRAQLACVLAASRESKNGKETEGTLSREVVQKVTLAEIALDSYAFTLLAAAAKDVEEGGLGNADAWKTALFALGHGMQNMSMSHILARETSATGKELLALAEYQGTLDFLRMKAAVDRARRATEDFSTAISDAYTRRVASLSSALDIDRRAAAVVAEAVIRGTLVFQSSRIADAATKKVRCELNIPPWDPLFNGVASGLVVFAECLADVKILSQATLAVCRKADGDEDIPANVRGVVLGHPLPHLSHLGVRARQSGVVFVCAEDPAVFEELWSGPSRLITEVATLSVSTVRGLEGLIEGESAPCKKDAGGDEPAVAELSESAVDIGVADVSDTKVLPLTGATKANASAKCAFAGLLATVAERSGGLFAAPNGACIPFGIYNAAAAANQAPLSKLMSKYDSAASANDSAAAADVAAEVRSFIETKISVNANVVSAIQKLLAEKDARVMVRSSANCEDLENMSGAGLYDSIANVSLWNSSDLEVAVRHVWASLWTERAASSRAAYHVPHSKAYMAVLIQPMVRAELSFVAFSHNPVDPSDSGNVYIELAVGMGETLASATTPGQPYRIRVDRKTPSIVSVDALASYGCALVPTSVEGEEGSASGLRRKVIDYSSERMTTDCEFRSAIASRIARVVLKLEAEFGGPQDVEGAVTGVDSANTADSSTLYVVQARPQVM
jgi:phosphoglucan, water dikinase